MIARWKIFSGWVLLWVSCSQGALTWDVDEHGQTVAPVGKDYLEWMYSKRKDGWNKTRMQYTSTIYSGRASRHTVSKSSAFYTLRESSCDESDKRGSFLKVVGLSGGDEAVVRHVSSAELSSIFDRAAEPMMGGKEDTIVLFHGGEGCEWSRTIWEAWVEATREFEGLCMVAINGARDPMLNNNLMVFGFPTVMRIGSETGSESFRGNRTGSALVEWIVGVTGRAPDGKRRSDRERFGIDKRRLRVFDVSEEGSSRGVDWALLGANIVSVGNVVWIMLQLGRMFGRGKEEETVNEE